MHEIGAKHAPALAEPTVVGDAFLPRRMALHAMANGDEIRTALERIGHHGFGEACLSVRVFVVPNRKLVDGCGRLAAHGLDRTQVGNSGIQVARQQRFEETHGHHRSQRHVREFAAIGARTLDQRASDFRIAPVTDASFAIGCDVRGARVESGSSERHSARKMVRHDWHTCRCERRMAVAARKYRIHQVTALIDQCR